MRKVLIVEDDQAMAVALRASRVHEEGDGVEAVRFGDVELNFRSFAAAKGGKPIELSPREFKMMRYFAERRGEVVTREQLLDHVWGYEGLPLTRTVDMHIAKLRQKIEDTPSDPHHIITVHRVGYKFTG